MRLDLPLTAECAERRPSQEPTKDEVLPATDAVNRVFDEYGRGKINKAESSDEVLMHLVRDTHDHLAFEILEHRYERPLRMYLRSRLRDSHAADDVSQDTWTNVYQFADSFQDNRLFRPWLYCIGTNRATDWQRRHNKRYIASLDRERGTLDGDQLSLLDLLVDDLAAPDEIAMIEEERARIRACTRELPEDYLNLVLAVRYEGLSYREAATKFNIPLGTVKSRLNKAVSKLGALLGIELPGSVEHQ